MEFVILSVFDMYVGRSRLLSFQKKKKNMERTAFRIETKKKKRKKNYKPKGKGLCTSTKNKQRKSIVKEKK